MRGSPAATGGGWQGQSEGVKQTSCEGRTESQHKVERLNPIRQKQRMVLAN